MNAGFTIAHTKTHPRTLSLPSSSMDVCTYVSACTNVNGQKVHCTIAHVSFDPSKKKEVAERLKALSPSLVPPHDPTCTLSLEKPTLYPKSKGLLTLPLTPSPSLRIWIEDLQQRATETLGDIADVKKVKPDHVTIAKLKFENKNRHIFMSAMKAPFVEKDSCDFVATQVRLYEAFKQGRNVIDPNYKDADGKDVDCHVFHWSYHFKIQNLPLHVQFLFSKKNDHTPSACTVLHIDSNVNETAVLKEVEKVMDSLDPPQDPMCSLTIQKPLQSTFLLSPSESLLVWIKAFQKKIIAALGEGTRVVDNSCNDGTYTITIPNIPQFQYDQTSSLDDSQPPPCLLVATLVQLCVSQGHPVASFPLQHSSSSSSSSSSSLLSFQN